MKREPRLGVKLPVGRDELPVSDQGYKARFANVVGAHLYSFGGVERTAAWMNRCITLRGHQA